MGNEAHKLCSYFPERRAKVYCFRLNFDISELGCSVVKNDQRWAAKPLAASSVSVARAFWDFTLSCLFALSPQILEQKRDFLFCYARYGNTRPKAEYLRPKFQNNSNIVMSRSTVVNIFVVYVNSSIDDEPGEPAHYSSREKTEKVFKKPKIIIWGLKKKHRSQFNQV